MSEAPSGAKKFWTRRNAIATSLLAVAITASLYLSIANSQNNRLVFMWQAYVLHRDVWMPPPDYSGSFRAWHWNGAKKVEATYKNGVIDGKVTRWDKNGDVVFERWFKNGEVYEPDQLSRPEA